MFQLINDNKTLYIRSSIRDDAGSYFCTARSKAGQAEKTFNVRVLLRPEMRGGADEVTVVEALVTTPTTFECPVVNAVGVDLSWSRHELPVVAGIDNVQILAGGRHLHIGAVQRHDAGTFTCVAKNEAGQASKKYKLVVLGE